MPDTYIVYTDIPEIINFENNLGPQNIQAKIFACFQ